MGAPRQKPASAEIVRWPHGRRLLPVVNASDCVPALRALGEDTRVRIVGLLIGHRLEVGEIARRLNLSTCNASKHLRILREAGLLDVEKDGRRHLYSLPEMVRRRASNGAVLDLGCCTFQFEPGAAQPNRHGTASLRKRLTSDARTVLPASSARK